jgi:hypothetical protein
MSPDLINFMENLPIRIEIEGLFDHFASIVFSHPVILNTNYDVDVADHH